MKKTRDPANLYANRQDQAPDETATAPAGGCRAILVRVLAMSDKELTKSLQPSFEKWEGRSPWLYLDYPPGNLTIGIGHLVYKKTEPRAKLEAGLKALLHYGMVSLRSDADYAIEYATYCVANSAKAPGPVRARKLESVQALLRRIEPETGRLGASKDNADLTPGVWGIDLPQAKDDAKNLAVLLAEAERILTLPSNWAKPIPFFECFNSYRLTDPAIDRIYSEDVQTKLKEIPAEEPFEEFSDFPVDAQSAILDLAFQVGARGLAEYKNFANAVSNQNWAQAAATQPFPCANTARLDRTRYRQNLLLDAERRRQVLPDRPSTPFERPTAFA